MRDNDKFETNLRILPIMEKTPYFFKTSETLNLQKKFCGFDFALETPPVPIA